MSIDFIDLIKENNACIFVLQIVKDLGGELAQTVAECTHLVTDKVRQILIFYRSLEINW